MCLFTIIIKIVIDEIVLRVECEDVIILFLLEGSVGNLCIYVCYIQHKTCWVGRDCGW